MQTEVAQSVAEDALGTAHGTEEKVEDMITDYNFKIDEINAKFDDLQKKMLKSVDVQKLIDDSIRKTERTASVTPMGSNMAMRNQPPTDDRFGRTVVLGGFARDTPKSEITDYVEKNVISCNAEVVDEIYAYAYGSVGFVRFVNKDEMWKFLKEFGKNKHQVGSKAIWATVSRTPEERKKGKTLSKYKRVLIEASIADAADIRVDYKRGALFLKQVKIGHWSEQEKFEIDPAKLKEAGISVGPTNLENAVNELLRKSE